MPHALRSGTCVAEALVLDLCGDPRALQTYAAQIRAMVQPFRLRHSEGYASERESNVEDRGDANPPQNLST